MHVHEYVADGSLPQEIQAHTAQNQQGLPKEQLTVDLKTCRKKKEQPCNFVHYDAEDSAKVNITYGIKMQMSYRISQSFPLIRSSVDSQYIDDDSIC